MGDKVNVKVDYTRRALVAKNHTATHILNFALRQVLGDKIDQKGSLVDEAKLRFDFSHNKPIELEEMQRIEQICNEEIQKKHAVNFQEVGLAKAKAINGLRAVFGETYPDPVRVVSVGPKVDDLLKDSKTPWGMEHSIEFCGGTHVSNTDEIHRFILQVEEGIAKGVRRIVAVTGVQAYGEAQLRTKTLSVRLDKAKGLAGQTLDKAIAEMRNEISATKEVSLVTKKNMLADLDVLNAGQVKAGKAATKEAEKKAKEEGERLAAEAAKGSGTTFVGIVNAGAGDDAKICAAAMDVVSKKCDSKAILLFSSGGGKLALLATVPKALQGQISAKDWASAALDTFGGKGGGSDAKYQGQGTDVSKLNAAVAAAKAFKAGGGGAAPAAAEGGKKKGGKDAKKDDKAAEKKDDPEAERKALLKKVVKEGGKRGVEIEGAADMGGLQFFCTAVEFPDGDVDLLLESMKAMNAKSDPSEEERKGGSGHIGKMIFSAGETQLAVVAYVPEEKQGDLSCKEWLEKVLSTQPGGKMLSNAKDISSGLVPTDKDKGIFPLKIREGMIMEANNFLRSKGLFPDDDDDDDDEYVFGDDDFPS